MARRGRGTRANGEGSLLRRTGTSLWYAQYYKDGRQIRVSTRTPIKAKALEELRRLMGKSESGLIPDSDLKKITYKQLREGLIASYEENCNRTLYQTADGGETIGGLKALDDFVGFEPDKNPGPPVTSLTTNLARQFARKRLAEGYNAATVNRSLACLRRMLNIAYEDGLLNRVPKIHFQTEPLPRKGFVTIQQFQNLLAALPVNLHPVILFLYWCGGRKGEAAQISWNQVDLERGIIRLEDEQTKTGEARVVPLPPVLIDILKKQESKSGLVFDTSNLRVEWAKACEACGFGKRERQKSGSGFTWYKYSGLIIHDLRRSAVRNLVNAGVPERVAMKISGHKTRSVFDRYHIVSTEDVTNAMQRVVAAAVPQRKRQRRLSANLVQVDRNNGRKLLRARSSNG